jgi:hypothetical protein
MNKVEPATVIPSFVFSLKKPDDIRNVMDNAKNKNRMDVYWAAFRRLCEVEGSGYSDQIDKDFYAGLSAYEALLHDKHKRNVKASRTRQKLSRHGVKKCLEDWALAKTATQGFYSLIENNMEHLTAEAIVLKHSNLFSDHVVQAAKSRLESAGVDVSVFQGVSNV